jgi:tetratricopeptide (TPR) repeat protein
MRRFLWAAPLAVVLLLAGGVGILGVSPAPSPTPGVAASAALLAPGGARSLDDLIESLQSHLQEYPGDWRALASLGLAYLQRGRLSADPAYYPKAEGVLVRSIRLRQDNFEASLGMAVLALGRHDFRAALRWGRAARAINPYSAQARGAIGDSLMEMGRYPGAARAFQAMVDLRPDVSSYARVSYFRQLTGDPSGAIEAMRMARDVSGTPGDAAWAGYHLGELYLDMGRLGRAEGAYRLAAASDPTAVPPQVGLAKVLAARGHLSQAIRDLDEVVEVYPAPEFALLLGDLLTSAGRHAEAADRYALVRATDRLYRAGGVDTDLEMALFHADHGRAATAVALARATYRSRPSIHAADALAWALHIAGRNAAADRFAREALRLGTRSPLFLFHAGTIAYTLGDRGRAHRLLLDALQLNPWFSFVHAATARLILSEVSP